MAESPLVYALVFFVLGFIAGWIAASLRQMLQPKSGTQHTEKVVRSDIPPQPTGLSSLSQSKMALHTPPPQVGEETPTSITLENEFTWLSNLPQSSGPERPQTKSTPLDSFLHNVKKSTIKEIPKTVSLAAEIDAILQEKLPASPLVGRSIHLEEQPDFGLLVIVDNDSYGGVDAVPDESIRALIQSAVAEWQRRASHT
jgi:hypothetical protein